MGNLIDCTPDVCLRVEDIRENTIIVTACEPLIYDAVEVNTLAVGDTVVCGDRIVPVEKLSDEDGVLINGGMDEGGIDITMDFEFPVFVEDGTAVLSLADQIIYSHRQGENDGSILEELAVRRSSHRLPADAKTASFSRTVW